MMRALGNEQIDVPLIYSGVMGDGTSQWAVQWGNQPLEFHSIGVHVLNGTCRCTCPSFKAISQSLNFGHSAQIANAEHHCYHISAALAELGMLPVADDTTPASTSDTATVTFSATPPKAATGDGLGFLKRHGARRCDLRRGVRR
jgi:hypothetical protein